VLAGCMEVSSVAQKRSRYTPHPSMVAFEKVPWEIRCTGTEPRMPIFWRGRAARTRPVVSVTLTARRARPAAR